MEILHFAPEDQLSIFRVLSSVLHLGNVYFQKHEVTSPVHLQYSYNTLASKIIQDRNNNIETSCNLLEEKKSHDFVLPAAKQADGQEVASVVSAQEIRVVAELLQISPDGLQKAITYKVTVSHALHGLACSII